MNFKVYYSGKCLNFFICFVLLSKITFMNLGFLLLFSHLSCVWLFVTSRKASTPGFPVLHISQSLLKLMTIELMMSSKHLTLCHPLFLLSSIFPNSKIFSNELALHIRWPKHWSFSFRNSPSSEYSGLISFRIDWLDLAVHGTFQSLL